jgi:hypothetical protein
MFPKDFKLSYTQDELEIVLLAAKVMELLKGVTVLREMEVVSEFNVSGKIKQAVDESNLGPQFWDNTSLVQLDTFQSRAKIWLKRFCGPIQAIVQIGESNQLHVFSFSKCQLQFDGTIQIAKPKTPY